MIANNSYLIAVSGHKEADDFFKKFKREVDQASSGNAVVMRAQLPDDGSTMVQIYPMVKVYPNLTIENSTEIVQFLFQEGTEPKLNEANQHYIDDLATLLRANMHITESNICGKCFPCRLGGPFIDLLLEQYQNKEIKDYSQTKKQLQDVGFSMKSASMCAIGMFGADPLLFALNKWPSYFSKV